jgi:deoxyadenosine/deoxycytidine kinase
VRIVLEGLPGAGKTTLGKKLSKELNSPLIPEFACFSAEELKQYNLRAPFYRVNEEIKEYIGNYFKEPLVIFDRHYIGVLAFAFSLNKVQEADDRGENYENEFLWYQQCLKNGLLTPANHVIFLDISPELSLERQPRAREFDSMFGNLDFLKNIQDYYYYYYQAVEPNLQVNILPGVLSEEEIFNTAMSYISSVLTK